MLTKKKLFILTDWYLPGFKAGGPIQSCRNLAEALGKDYEVFIFTGDRDLGDDQPYSGIPFNRWIPVGSASVFYADTTSQSAAGLLKQLQQIRPDIILLNSLFSPRFTLQPLWLLWRNKINARVVLCPRGMLQAGALKYKRLKKDLFLKLLVFSGLPRRIHFLATDPQEFQDIKNHFPAASSVTLAENFPNISDFTTRPVEKQAGKLKLVYLARISPIKNLLFVLELLNRFPLPGTIEFTIAGKVEDEGYWKRCTALMDSIPANITVQIAGAVAHEKLLDWLQPYHLFILPTFGENFGHGIFEAFLAGKPVIISDKTPWRSLQSKGLGWDIPLDRPEAFIDAIRVMLEMDQAGYDHLSARCHQFAIEYRNNHETRRKYLELFG